MIQFRAFVNIDPQTSIADTVAQRWKKPEIFPQLGQEWTVHRKNVFMSIHGDCALEGRAYSSPRLDLICHADLLGSGSCDDFREANQRPAEYLARRYEQRGDDLAQDLRGWFAIVLYDYDQNALKVWTDHFGVRRIVYRAAPGALAVASDLRLLNEFADKVPEIDPAALVEYLQYSCIPAPRTIYRDTFRLEPGHRLTSRPTVSSRVYWDMHYEEKQGIGLESWSMQAYQAIESAVDRASKTADPAHHPGCFLSGGTDSSSVSGFVGKSTGRAPTTISIGFDDPRYNEIEYARTAARHFRTDHHEYFVTPGDILSLIQKAYAVYDEPFGNSSIIPAYYCARMGLESGVSHMLAGDGGDELFGGNQRYANDRIFERYAALPKSLRAYFIDPLVSVGAGMRMRPFDLARRYIRRASIPPPDRYFSYDFLASVNRTELFSRSFSKALNGTDPLAAARRHFQGARAACDLNRWLYLDIKITITDNDLRKVTPMTELAGVVPRYPLLDPELAEFSGTVPARLKVRGTRLRYLFKEAMKGFLPPEILAKKKHGFGLPFSVWLGEHQPLHDFVFDVLGSKCARERGYLRPDLLEWLWACRQSDSPIYYGDVLWVFLMLELWHLSVQSSVSGKSN